MSKMSVLNSPDSTGNSEDHYEVDKILNERISGGKKHYLIRWKGYSSFVKYVLTKIN
jgi:hypothetical protein